MRRYKPEYDTREVKFDITYDCDYRLGEIPGDCLWIGSFKSYVDDNDHEIEFTVVVEDISCYGKRSFNRHYRKHGYKPYIKIRKIDWTDNIVIGICRLNLLSPEYITGFNENITLSTDEINMLLKFLNDGSEYTRWVRIIYTMNKIYGGLITHYSLPNKLKIPNYIKLNM